MPPELKKQMEHALVKYANAEKSGLTVTVQQGTQTFDIDLKP
jgi:hypothetical protein